MPRYRVVSYPTYLNHSMRAVGEEVEFAGWPGSTLEPIDDVAVRIKSHFEARRRDRKAPRVPDLAQFAEAAPETETPARRRHVKDDTNG